MSNFLVTTTTSGKSIILNINNSDVETNSSRTSKYVFGCFEGFQRYCTEAKIKTIKFNKFFVIKKDDVIPIISTYLTHSDDYIKTSDNSIDNKNYNDIEIYYNSKECKNIINIEKYSKFKTKLNNNYVDKIKNKVRKLQLIETSVYVDKNLEIKSFRNKKYINYRISFNEILGSIIKEKLPHPSELPPYYIKDLKNGKNIEYKNKIFYSKDYKEPNLQIGIVYILSNIINNKSNDILNSEDTSNYDLINILTKDIENITNPNKMDKNLKVIFCLHKETYKKIKNLINKVNKNIFNEIKLIYVDKNCEIDIKSSYELCKKLNKKNKNYLVPFNFSKIYPKYQINKNNENKFYNKIYNQIDNIHKVYNLDTLFFNKKQQVFLINRMNKSLNIEKNINNINEIEYIQNINKENKYNNFYKNIFKENNLLFLGTGSGSPSNYRNVSSILLNYKKIKILLDCGEDTFGQLKRLFLIKKYNKNNIKFYKTEIFYKLIKDIKIILITHSHEDHYLGIIKLIKYKIKLANINKISNKNTNKKILKIFGPKKVKEFIKIFIKKKYIKKYIKYKCIDKNLISNKIKSINLKYKPNKIYKTIKNCISKKIDENYKENIFINIMYCKVIHNKDSVGYSIIFKKLNENYIKISYSGDCRPTPSFIQMVNKSDVLIHESTFDDNLKENAINFKHTTTNEAIEVYKKSQSKKLILTHFSQRYPQIQEIKKFEDSNLITDNKNIETLILEDTMNNTYLNNEKIYVAMDYFYFRIN